MLTDRGRSTHPRHQARRAYRLPLILAGALVPLLALALPSGASAALPAVKPVQRATVIAPVAVTIAGFAYLPKTVTVAAGTPIVFTNKDDSLHTVTSDHAAFAESPDISRGGKSYTLTLTKPGTYAYHCGYHPYMMGTIIVTAAPKRE